MKIQKLLKILILTLCSCIAITNLAYADGWCLWKTQDGLFHLEQTDIAQCKNNYHGQWDNKASKDELIRFREKISKLNASRNAEIAKSAGNWCLWQTSNRQMYFEKATETVCNTNNGKWYFAISPEGVKEIQQTVENANNKILGWCLWQTQDGLFHVEQTDIAQCKTNYHGQWEKSISQDDLTKFREKISKMNAKKYAEIEKSAGNWCLWQTSDNKLHFERATEDVCNTSNGKWYPAISKEGVVEMQQTVAKTNATKEEKT